MRVRVGLPLLLSFAAEAVLLGQGRPVDWPSQGGNAQRTGWQKSDSRMTRENIKDFKLVLKHKFEWTGKGARALTPPVVIGRLISYRGFKELGFVASGSDHLWSLDVDLDRVFWDKQIGSVAAKQKVTASCPGGLTATPSLTPPIVFGRRPASTAPARPPGARRPAAGFGVAQPIYVLASDGKLHQLNTSNGAAQFPAVDFVPPGSAATSLVMAENTLYTSTAAACGGSPVSVWALDLDEATPKAVKVELGSDSASPVALGTDGTVYVQTGPGGHWPTSLVAFSRELKVKDYVRGAGSGGPLVFTYKDHEWIAATGAGGKIRLLDSASLGGENHGTPVFESESLNTTANARIGLVTWEDESGKRWIAASVDGPLNPKLHLPGEHAPVPHGSVVAFRVDEEDTKPVLTPIWISPDLVNPDSPVVTADHVFALAAGSRAAHPMFYALEAATGKVVFSSGNQIAAPANRNGLTVVNGRVYFTTNDGSLYAFGVYLER